MGHVLYRGTLTQSRDVQLETPEVRTDREWIEASSDGWVADPSVAEQQARRRGVVYEFPLKCFRGFEDEEFRTRIAERVVHNHDELAEAFASGWTTDQGQAGQSAFLDRFEHLEREERAERDAERRRRRARLDDVPRSLVENGTPPRLQLPTGLRKPRFPRRTLRTNPHHRP